MANDCKLILFAACLIAGIGVGAASFADSGKDAANLEQALKNHTLVFIDNRSGVENTIYFGRFGRSFDRYVPCVETAGTWKVADGNRLCFEEDEGPLKACFKIDLSGESVSLSGEDGATVQTAKLLDGNRLPFG